MNRLFLIGLTLTACGGSNLAAFHAAAPTFNDVAVAQNDADNVEPAEAPPPAGASAAATVSTADCHPHLFARVHEVTERLNRHFAKQLRHLRIAMRHEGKLADGETAVFEEVEDGIDRRFTITRSADGETFTFKLELATAGTNPSFVNIATGSVTITETGSVVERKGTMTFDYSALASVVTTEKASGQIEADFDIVKDPSKPAPGVKKAMTIKFVNFLPEEGDPHGPRNGNYRHVREPAVGGLLSFQTSVVLLCPANPTSLPAEVTEVARWYRASDGGVHGRGDALATGGQIASGDKWEGVTCAEGQTTSAPAEGFWMMKEEDATGATITASSVSVGATPCDPVFGAVPDVNGPAHDYDFSAAVSFPNQW